MKRSVAELGAIGRNLNQIARALNQGRAVIHTIELSIGNRERSEMPLQALARDNRGTYRAVALEE